MDVIEVPQEGEAVIVLVYAGVLLISFVFAVALGWFMIPFLQRRRIGQSIRGIAADPSEQGGD